jgi:glycosyltransferase involved in cell wall biosynthesis
VGVGALISLLIPTRGRPQNITRLVDSVAQTAASNDWEIVWSVDEDDLPTIEAIRGLDEAHHQLLIAERAIPSVRWNEAWAHARGDIFGLFGDDCVWQAPGWDQMVEAAFTEYPDRLALVYGPDGFRNQIHASHPFISRQWTELFGRVLVTHFGHDWSDTWLNDVAEAAARRHYIPELWIQHMHPDDPSLGVENDRIYHENRERTSRDEGAKTYLTLAPEREKDIEKLRAAIGAA